MTTTTEDQTTLKAKLDALSQSSIGDLRILWQKLYRAAPPPMIGRDLLILAVAWKLQVQVQVQVLGGLSSAVKRRIASMEAKGGVAKARTVQPKPGARLMRAWQGRTHTVLMLDDGFEWQGARHASLSLGNRAKNHRHTLVRSALLRECRWHLRGDRGGHHRRR